jgi:hypothetical protein
MSSEPVARLRSFNRMVTERVGALEAECYVAPIIEGRSVRFEVR